MAANAFTQVLDAYVTLETSKRNDPFGDSQAAVNTPDRVSNGNSTTSVIPEDKNKILYLGIAAAVLVGAAVLIKSV